MPFPALLVWGAAAAVAAVGVKKGVDAYNDFDRAKEIGNRAESKFNKAKDKLEKNRNKTKQALEDLGYLKVNVFTNQIQHVINVLSQVGNKRASALLKNSKESFSVEDLKECNIAVSEIKALDLTKTVVSGAAVGALLSYGALGGVGTFAAASTGTLISGLSGAAATNATLAWLGGGSLAAGGFGMAGGMIALGGIALAPVLAIGGFMLASKAEEAVSNAYAYESDVSKAVEDMKLIKTNLKAIVAAKDELTSTIERLVSIFEEVKVDAYAKDSDIERMLLVAKSLKVALQTAIMDKEGIADPHIVNKCEGLLKISSEPKLLT